MSQSVVNPFYRRIQQDGFRIVVERPQSRTKHYREATNPIAERIRRDGMRIHRHRGRPAQDVAGTVEPTQTKSIRLPPKIWREVDLQAAREGKSRHAALREAVLIWLQS